MTASLLVGGTGRCRQARPVTFILARRQPRHRPLCRAGRVSHLRRAGAEGGLQPEERRHRLHRACWRRSSTAPPTSWKRSAPRPTPSRAAYSRTMSRERGDPPRLQGDAAAGSAAAAISTPRCAKAWSASGGWSISSPPNAATCMPSCASAPTRWAPTSARSPTTPPISPAPRVFLLDATVGLINIEQNNIIKIVSVVSVLIMPPTLIASIYGMNFQLHAGARLAVRLSACARRHGWRGHPALLVSSSAAAGCEPRERRVRPARIPDARHAEVERARIRGVRDARRC